MSIHIVSLNKLNQINVPVSVVQKQTAVSDYLKSELLLLFAFARHNLP